MQDNREPQPTDPITRVVVVGGGTAGWITAGTIAARQHRRGGQPVSITLVESPEAPIIGVGEGTWPTLRNTLLTLGIRETDFIRQCHASFKQGARFTGWKTGAADDFYYHPLMLPQGFTRGSLVPFWQSLKRTGELSFSRALCAQEALCEAGLAPKTIRTPEFQAQANYAYHLDAGRFTQLLHEHCTQKLGVKYISAHVNSIATAANGDITHLHTREEQVIAGDLFIDCTGFAARLLGEHFDVPFVDCQHTLFADRALAAQLPYPAEDSPIASTTLSTAQKAGWIWDIGLYRRRGIGYVYSSAHCSEAEAEACLRRYMGPAGETLPLKQLTIRPGYREKFWQNNCVAVGLSAGFLEPLEASALVLVELSAAMIAEQLPANRAVMDIIARRFNDTFRYRWERIIDFLKLHYCLSQRTDSEFWRDNTRAATIPESLQELLDLWRYQAPGDYDFTSNNEVFPAASYQYVLYGMGFDSPGIEACERDIAFGRQQSEVVQKATAEALRQLPGNRELLDKIHTFGLQTL